MAPRKPKTPAVPETPAEEMVKAAVDTAIDPQAAPSESLAAIELLADRGFPETCPVDGNAVLDPSAPCPVCGN